MSSIIIDDYVKKQMKLINSLPDDHFIHTIIVSNGMRYDLAKHPVLHKAMMELLSSGFTVKMGGIGMGTFIATKSKFEFRFFLGKNNVVCIVYMKGKQIFEFNAEIKSFYEFEVEKGRLTYDRLFLACHTTKYQSVNREGIEKFIGGKK